MGVNECLNNSCSDDVNELIISRAQVAFYGGALARQGVVYEKKIIAFDVLVNEDTSRRSIESRVLTQ